jgi:hypothetical protein
MASFSVSDSNSQNDVDFMKVLELLRKAMYEHPAMRGRTVADDVANLNDHEMIERAKMEAALYHDGWED